MRRKHRWVAFEIIGGRVSRSDFIKAFRRKAIELFGTFGIADLNIILVEYDESAGRGIMRVPLDVMDMVRTVFFFLRNVGGNRILVNDVLVSGTLKALKGKLEGRFWEGGNP